MQRGAGPADLEPGSVGNAVGRRALPGGRDRLRHRGGAASGLELRAVEPGHSGRDGRDEVFGDPAGVLGALVLEHEVRVAPEPVLPSRRVNRAQCGVGVGADELEAVEDELHLAGADVVADQHGKRGAGKLAAVRTLQVGVLDERHRGRGRAERRAVLGDPVEERSGLRCHRDGLRGGRGSRSLAVHETRADECGGYGDSDRRGDDDHPLAVHTLTLSPRAMGRLGSDYGSSCGKARIMRAPMSELTNERTRALVEAGIALASELSLDAVLQKLVEAAAKLTGARYAALGVVDRAGLGLERFITTGIDAETFERIGEPPSGGGILGVLITDARPLRLHDLHDDPRSVGFPPNHPEMRTFLGMPVLLRDVSYGNLYLTEKEGGGDFTAEDEELTALLAAQAAVAIENARLYESATRWLAQLESLNEIGNALVSEVGLSRQLQLVAQHLRTLLNARIVTVNLPNRDGTLQVAAADGDGADELLTLTVGARSKSTVVLGTRRGQRVDSVIDDPDVDQVAAQLLGARTGLYVPLVTRDRAIGVIEVHDRLGADPRFTDDDLRLAESFASRAAVAVDLSDRVARDSLRAVVAAQELERRRLARELHDETGQALTSILLGLKAMEDAKTDEQVRAAGGALRELVVHTLQDVRQLAVELRPKALDDFGLIAALERLVETWAEQTQIIVELEARLSGRLQTEVETALYRIVQEALTNIVKHARASHVSIVLSERGKAVSVVIEDDGIGFVLEGAREDGLGLVGMRERVGLVGGRLRVESRSGAGTTLFVEVPLP